MDKKKQTKPKFIYQNSAYYGIFFPTILEDHVMDIVETTKYKTLYEDDTKTKVGRFEISSSSNSDGKSPAWCFILVDDMTIAGDDMETSSDVTVKLDPTEMLNLEKKCAVAIKALEELYTIITAELKKKNVAAEDLSDVDMGWRVLSCEFLKEEVGELSASVTSTKTVPTKQATTKKTPTKKTATK